MDEDDLDVAERIAERGERDRFAEADARLDRVRAGYAATFRGDRFRYALARARLASARGAADEAAAFAAGALWQLEDDAEGPELPRHPTVGRVRAGGRTRRELRRLAGGGDGERYDPVAEQFRSPSSGAVQWTWALVERLRPNPAVAGRHDDRIATSRRNAEPLLHELRAAGYEAFDLAELGNRRLPDRGAAEILVAWLDRVGDPLSRSLIAMALTDQKARAVAAQPLLDLFAALPPEADEKDRVAAAAGTLARDPQFEQVAALVRDRAHGHYRSYLMTAVEYMRTRAPSTSASSSSTTTRSGTRRCRRCAGCARAAPGRCSSGSPPSRRRARAPTPRSGSATASAWRRAAWSSSTAPRRRAAAAVP